MSKVFFSSFCRIMVLGTFFTLTTLLTTIHAFILGEQNKYITPKYTMVVSTCRNPQKLHKKFFRTPMKRIYVK